MDRFADREEAGTQLAARLAGTPRTDVIVLALPRGGVPVAYAVAKRLRAPLDVLVVRKLGAPGREELAVGAIARGVRVLNEGIVERLGLNDDQLAAIANRESIEVERRETAYRQGRPAAPVGGHHVMLVDDGLATGATMRAAVQAVKLMAPKQITVAVPVAPGATCRELREAGVEVVALHEPENFTAVSEGYRSFPQVKDAEVIGLLAAASTVAETLPSPGAAGAQDPS
ncbi:MAG TPA: phosphoribosyltransferase family protein [Deinococcales bacterium]|nr:phosphoribosyltransferase family protein [Deinococcales bacterium]